MIDININENTKYLCNKRLYFIEFNLIYVNDMLVAKNSKNLKNV